MTVALSPYFITTGAGIAFDYANPQPEMIEPRALAAALAMENRWCNNLLFPYSVAQHSLLVAENIAEPAFRIYGLLHDAAEAFTRDLPTPLKRLLQSQGADIGLLEINILAAVWQRFDLPWPSGSADDAVAEADARALATEWRDVVRGKSDDWAPPAKPFGRPIRFMKPDRVEALFLERLDAYRAEALTGAGRALIASD